jgi:hypothetical protein
MMFATNDRKWTIRAALLLGLVASFFLPSGARAQGDEPVTLTTVRFVNAVPEGPALDISIDGHLVAQGVDFGAVTDYITVTPGERQIEAMAGGQKVATGDPSLDEASSYIITFIGQVGDVGVKVNEVKLGALDPDMARIRVVHASPDAGEVELVVSGGDTLFDGIEFEEDTHYKEIDAGNYQFEVRTGDDQMLLSSFPLDVLSGRVYDLVAIGLVGNQTFRVMPLVTNVSPPCSELLGIGTPDDACVRLTHGQPGLGEADAAVAGKLIGEGLPFGEATEFVAVPAGEDLAISLAPTGDETGGAEPQTFTLQPGQAYEIVAWSDAGEATATAQENTRIDLFEIDLTPLPEHQARVRLINAAGDAGEVDIIVPVLGDDAELFSGVGEGDASGYSVLTEGVYPFEVHYTSEEAAFFETEIEIQSGVVYDVVAIGLTEDESFMLLVLTAPAEIRSDSATPAAMVPGVTPAATPVSSS